MTDPMTPERRAELRRVWLAPPGDQYSVCIHARELLALLDAADECDRLADALDKDPTRPEPVDLSDELDDLADCTKLFAEAMLKMKEASEAVARRSVARLPREWTDVDFEDPDHIWLNAFKCIRPTGEFAAEVGRSVIARAMQAHPKRVALTVNAS